MNVECIWSRLNRVLALLLLISAGLLVAVWYLPLIRDNRNMRKEELRLDDEIRLVETKVRQKKSTIEALRTDPRTIERLAREKLGLARPGETVVHFEDPAPTPPSPRP